MGALVEEALKLISQGKVKVIAIKKPFIVYLRVSYYIEFEVDITLQTSIGIIFKSLDLSTITSMEKKMCNFLTF